MINITSFNKVYDSVQKTYNNHREGTCLSTDTKPVNVAPNSIFLQLNGGFFYYFDGANWKRVGS